MSVQDQPYLLLVDSNRSDVDLVIRLLRKQGFTSPIVVFLDGAEALEYLQAQKFDRNNSKPALIVLGYSLLKLNGLELLELLGRNNRLKDIPVVLFTSSLVSGAAVEQAHALGVCAVIEKPTDYHEFQESVGMLMAFWQKRAMPMKTNYLCTGWLRKAAKIT